MREPLERQCLPAEEEAKLGSAWMTGLVSAAVPNSLCVFKARDGFRSSRDAFFAPQRNSVSYGFRNSFARFSRWSDRQAVFA